MKNEPAARPGWPRSPTTRGRRDRGRRGVPRGVHLHRAELTAPSRSAGPAVRPDRRSCPVAAGRSKRRASRRAVVRKPVWPTMRWSGRTERASTCQVRRRISRSRPCRSRSGPWRRAAWRRLVDRRQVGAEDPPGRSALSAWGSTRHGSGRSSTTRSRPSLVDALVDVADLHPVARRPRPTRPPRCSGPVAAKSVPQLVADHLGTGPQQRHRQRPRSHPGLEDPHAGADVRRDEDGAEVLRVDDLGPAGHLEHDVGQGGAHDQKSPAGAPEHRRPLGSPDQVVVGDDARRGCGTRRRCAA